MIHSSENSTIWKSDLFEVGSAESLKTARTGGLKAQLTTTGVPRLRISADVCFILGLFKGER